MSCTMGSSTTAAEKMTTSRRSRMKKSSSSSQTQTKRRVQFAPPPCRLEWPSQTQSTQQNDDTNDHSDDEEIAENNDDDDSSIEVLKVVPPPNAAGSRSQNDNDSSSFSRSSRQSLSFVKKASSSDGRREGVVNSAKKHASSTIKTEKHTKQQRCNHHSSFSKSGRSSLSKSSLSNSSSSMPLSSSALLSRMQLWQDTFTPKSSADLCIAPKKVKEISLWIQTALDALGGAAGAAHYHQNNSNSNLPSFSHSDYAHPAMTVPPKLLILVGSPGIGKSTAVRLLAQEMKVNVHEWSESISSYSNHYEEGGESGYGTLLHVDYESPITSFETFLRQAGAGLNSLVLEDTNNIAASKKKKKARLSHANNDSSIRTKKQSIILLEEIPNLHGIEAQLRFRTIMNSHIRESSVPTILIFSDVVEGRHRPDDLERLVDHSLLYNSSAVHVIQIHPPTKAKMKKIVEGILKQKGLQYLSSSTSSSSSNFFEDLYTRSGGDLRFAITALQMEGTGRSASISCSQMDKKKNSSGDSQNRDTKLGTFHALGKLLYAKRKQEPPRPVEPGMELWEDGRPPLDFDPERVVDHSEIELSGALTFVEFHSAEFFTDISELDQAFGAFSDAAYFLDSQMGSGRSEESIYPQAYAGSLTGRAVAAFNKHPAPNKFRQFSAPTIYDVMRKRSENQSRFAALNRRLSHSFSGEFATSSIFQPTDQFTTDCLTYVRTILPDTVGASLSKLHSYVRPRYDDDGEDHDNLSKTSFHQKQNNQNEEELELMMKEQHEILRSDDIVDFDSDDDDAQVPQQGWTE